MPGLNGFQATRAISRDAGDEAHPDHPVHVEEPGDRQDLGHAPGRARLRREAGGPGRAPREDHRARLTRRLTTRPMARPARIDLRSFQQELATRLASKTAAQVESSRLGLALRGERWLIRLADAGRSRGRAAARRGAADAAVVPRPRQHSRQSLQRRRLRRLPRARDGRAARHERTEPAHPVRAAGGRPERRRRRAERARPSQCCRSHADSVACRTRPRGTASAGPIRTAARGRNSTSRGSRRIETFLRVRL